MQWLIDNWALLASIIAAIALIGLKVRDYLRMSEEEQAKADKELMKAVMDWLLLAVTEAEKELGAGTGKLKIRAVYERALAVFGPDLTRVLTLDQLDALAQRPLEEMRRMLAANANAAKYVNGEG